MNNYKEYIDKFFEHKLEIDNTYTYEQSVNDVKEKLIYLFNKKLLSFNKNIEYKYDSNNFPKIIHFTCKDKINITNSVWKDCLNEYYRIYPDYKIIIYDDNDIFNIIQKFNKKNLYIIKTIKIGAVLADIFRYLILYLRGGYYSDMDCFPHKRIEELSNIQYHGNDKNNIKVYSKNCKLQNAEQDFHINPCNNCNLINVQNNSNKDSRLVYNCLGHNYINNDTTIIVGYEYNKTWHADLINGNQKHLWTDNNIGICQWFIGAKPQEKLFLKCYKKSLENISKIDINDKTNYHYNVINSTGPLFFTKMINNFLSEKKDFKNKICILPCDFFCCGSYYNKVPSTKNKFIEHKFTGTWLK